MNSPIQLIFGIGIALIVIGSGLIIGGAILLGINGVSDLDSPAYIFMVAAGCLLIFGGLMFACMARIQKNRLKMYGYPNVSVAYNYPGPNQTAGPSYSYQVTYGNQQQAQGPSPYVIPQPYVEPSYKV